MLFVDEDRQRRKLYGKAGCFRFKDYGTSAGVEYRTLSNAVITSKDVFMFCFDQLIKALEAFNQGVDFLKYGDDIQEAVNNYNINLAEKICEELSILMPLLESA